MRKLLQLKYAILAILSSVIIFTSDTSLTFAPPCDTPDHPDYAPLMALFNATDGPNWNNSAGWGEDCDVCEWYGVSCKGVDNRVWRVSMSSNNLTGTLPKNIVEIEYLEQVILGSNNIEGSFPLFLYSLPVLNRLDLANNNFSGLIPTEISSFPELSLLNLKGNIFNGAIGEEIFNITNLSNLDLSNNVFEGSLPNNINNASSLTRLVLSDNNLSGSLPEELFNLTQLTQLQLQDNNFSGEISSNLGGLVSLDYLNISDNNLSGSLPVSVGALQNLRSFFGSNNQLNGNIPNELTSLLKLEKLNLRSNNLSGSLPINIGNLINLDFLDLSINSISGELPTSLSDLSKLKSLVLFENEFSGVFLPELVNLNSLTHLNLRTNNLTGCFPDEYIDWCVKFSTNTFTGNCTFENPNFDQFCNGENCKDGFEFQVNALDHCEGDEIEIELLNSYTYSYEWSEPNQTTKILSTIASASKYYYVTVTNSRGCTKTDSIFIEVISTDTGFESDEICPGKTTEINGEIFNEVGTFQQSLPRPGSCDSIVNVTITQKEGTTGTYAETICPGTFTTINGQEFGSGISTQTIDNQAGCDSVITITISEFPTYEANLAFEVCEGTTYNFEGQELSAGLTTLELLSQYNCDSIINIDISEKPRTYHSISASFCAGGNVEINDETYSSADTYFQTLTNAVGCDSILTIVVSEKEVSYGTSEETICEGDSVLIAGNYYFDGGTFSSTLSNEEDCDSFLTISITLLPSEVTNLNEFICSEESFEIGTESFNTGGIHEVVLQNQNGCDSIVNLNLTVISGEDQVINASTCAGTPYSFAGNLYYNTTTVQDSVIINGCKSLTTLNLEVVEPIFYEYDAYICEGGYEFFHGYFYTEPTSQSVKLQTKQGCDSTVTMNLFVKENIVVEIDTFLCEGESIYFDNQFYNNPGRIEIPRKTSYGCDSITFLNIDLYESITDTFYIEVCEGSETEFEGAVYGKGEHSGTYDDGNCEQNFELIVTEVEKLRYDEVIEICTGGEREFMGITYYEGGKYNLNLDINECEILENLIVVESSNSEVIVPQVFCEGTSVILEGNEITSSGDYSVSSDIECEDAYVSVLIISGETVTIEKTIEEGHSYEFNGVRYNTSGVYEFIVGGENGCPTGIVLKLTVEKCGGLRKESIVLCDGESFTFYDKEISSTGIYEYVKPLVIGCDSIIQLSAEVVPEFSFSIKGSEYICPGEELILSAPGGYEYLWSTGAQTSTIIIHKGGRYELTIFDENNCPAYAEINIEEVVFPSSAIGIYVDDPTSCDAQNGRIELDVEMEYKYLFSIDGGENFQASNTFLNLPNGSYNIVLSDLLGRCNKAIESPVVLESIGVPQIQAIDIIPINDCLNQLGGIEIIPSDNEQNYQYSIDNGETWSDNRLFENLDSGEYKVVMRVVGSTCLNNLSPLIFLVNIGVLKADFQYVKNVSCTNVEDGKIGIQVIQGQPPYQVEWSNGGSGLYQNNLALGQYYTTITDANGCTQVLDVIIEGTDVEDLLGDFEDVILCSNDTLLYNTDSLFQYILFKDDIIFYEGQNPTISEPGTYQIIIENGVGCIVDKYFLVEEIDLSELGIDFLLSTEAVKGVEVIAVNISDPMPEYFEWQLDTSIIAVKDIDMYSNGLTFKDTGSYNISLLTEVNGCLASFDKTIVVYADSSELGTYEFPSLPLTSNVFNSWKIYENPSAGRFNVEINVNVSSIPIQISIYDIFGAKIANRSFLCDKENLETFNLEFAGNGVYTVVLRVLNQQFSKNILIIE